MRHVAQLTTAHHRRPLLALARISPAIAAGPLPRIVVAPLARWSSSASSPSSPPPPAFVLHQLVMTGQTGLMQLALMDPQIGGERLEEPDEHGNTPMCIAALSLQTDMIKLLASRGANINSRGGKDNTPLHFAVVAVAATRDRAEKDGDKDGEDGAMDLSVTSAEQVPQMDTVRCLLSLGANTFLTNRKNLSPFVTAALLQRWDIVDEMISEERRRNLNCGEAEFYSPNAPYDGRLHILANHGKISLMKRLLQENGLSVHEEDAAQKTALHAAAMHNKPRTLQFLLDMGGDPGHCHDGWTVLHEAAAQGAVPIIDLLSKSHPHLIAVHTTDSSRSAPLHVAVEADNVDAVKALITAGADVSVREARGMTPLHLAVGSPAIILALLQQRADPNAVSKEGLTPLHGAVLEGDDRSLEILLKFHADPNLVPVASNPPPSSNRKADKRVAMSALGLARVMLQEASGTQVEPGPIQQQVGAELRQMERVVALMEAHASTPRLSGRDTKQKHGSNKKR